MKKPIALILGASILLLAGCCSTHKRSQWEYKNLTVVASDPDRNGWLNRLGKEGWVVCGFAAQPATNQVPGPGKLYEYHYVFKRKAE